MFGTIITELPIDLVTYQEHVVLEYNIPQLFQLVLGVEITGRVVRVADQDRFGSRGDMAVKLLDGRQCEIVFNR